MYVSYKDVHGFHIVGADDELGTLHDCYIDSQTWQIRHVVLEAGGWFSSNKLLLRSDQVTGANVEQRRLMTVLKRSDLASAPSAGTVQTVDDLNQIHWSVAHSQGLMLVDLPGAALPYTMIEPVAPIAEETAAEGVEDEASRHLRSANELLGYELQGTDERIGTVNDLILNPADWSVAWLSVDTGNWLPGRLIVVAPDWVTDVSWEERSFSVGVTTRQIEESPQLADLKGLERSAEEALHAFYALPMI